MRERHVLRDISLDVARGEFIAIMGESGVGKSTLLNLIAGLDTPDRGSVMIDDVDLGSLDDNARTLLRRDRMGFVFQAFHLLPHLTIAQNVRLPLDLARVERREAERRTSAMLEAVGIAQLARDYPRTVSGGEAQRAAIARALVHAPRLLLADEPTGNLDAASAAQVLALLRDQVKRLGATAILVTHSSAAAATADRIYVLSAEGLARQAHVSLWRATPSLSLLHAAGGASWRDQPGRVALAVLGIAFGVALGVAVHLINSSAANEFNLAVRALAGEADLIVRGPRSGFPIRSTPPSHDCRARATPARRWKSTRRSKAADTRSRSSASTRFARCKSSASSLPTAARPSSSF